ncbi:COG4648 family protein [Breznakiellaceae bacterium SP9]
MMKHFIFKHRHLKFTVGAVAVLYPVLIFFSLVVFKLPIQNLSFIIIVFAVVYFIINLQHSTGKRSPLTYVSPAILFSIGLICAFTKSNTVIKLYPALADVAYIVVVGTTFYIPPTIVFSFIHAFDKNITQKIPKPAFDLYCFKATLAWCLFFVFDGLVSVVTTFWTSETLWGIYNAGVSYALMVLVFLADLIVLKLMIKKEKHARAASQNQKIVEEKAHET